MLSIKEQNVYFNHTIIIDIDTSSMCEIPILSDGMYIINISCQFDEPAIIGIFIDQNEDSQHSTESYELNSKKSHFLLVHQVLNLKTNNLITIKYLSNEPNKIINSENIIKLWKL